MRASTYMPGTSNGASGPPMPNCVPYGGSASGAPLLAPADGTRLECPMPLQAHKSATAAARNSDRFFITTAYPRARHYNAPSVRTQRHGLTISRASGSPTPFVRVAYGEYEPDLNA